MTMVVLEVAPQEEMEHGLVVVVDEQEVVDALVVGGEEVVDEEEDETPAEEVVLTAPQVYQKMIKAMMKTFQCTLILNRKVKWTLKLSFQGQ